MVEIQKPDFENMSDNKKYFIIGLGVFIVLLIFFMLYVSFAGKNSNKVKRTVQKGDFTIWTVGEGNNFSQFISDYKSKHKNLSSLSINVVNFPDYNSYYYALSSAFIKGQAPDIFVINNNEKALIFDEKIMYFTPSEISPTDFRKHFAPVFSKDLIKKIESDGKTNEYVVGIPLGYETLGVIYNDDLLREIDGNVNEKILSWSGIDEIIESLEENNSSIIPIGLGNSKVYYTGDIIANFLIQSGVSYVGGNKLSQAVSTFIEYGRTKKSFIKEKESDIELFKNGKLAMIIAYPRILNKLAGMGDSDYVKASYFPIKSSTSKNTLVNYNFYVVNADSKKMDLAKQIVAYFASKNGAKKYYEITKNYYLFPALLSIKPEIKEELVNNEFDIYLKDFENKRYSLKSFDKKLKFYYDKNILKVVDAGFYNYQTELQNFTKSLNCLANKIIYLKNLSSNCE